MIQSDTIYCYKIFPKLIFMPCTDVFFLFLGKMAGEEDKQTELESKQCKQNG